MFRTNLIMMSSKVADKATTRTKEEVGIFIGQTGQSIECETIHRHIDGGREERSFIEMNPVNVVVIGHKLLNYPIPSSDLLLYTLGSVKEVSLPSDMKVRQRMGRRELEGMNMGSANTIKGEMGRPGIDSNQTLTIRLLHKSIHHNICTNHAKRLTGTNVDRSSEGRLMRT
jgi:hypothetical protein